MAASILAPISRHLPRILISSSRFGTVFTQPTKQFHNTLVKHRLIINMGSYFKPSPNKILKLRKRDKVPEEFEMIYKAPMELSIRAGYPIILFCTVAAPAYAFFSFYKNGKMVLQRGPSEKVKFRNPERELKIFTLSLFVITVAAFAVLFKFPFRVYKHNDKNEYIAIFLSVFPMMLRKFSFQTASKTIFKNPLYFFMGDCQYILNKKKAFLLPHYFRTPSDLCQMMGVD